MDKILIRNLHVQGILGVNDWERTTHREIIINATVFTDTRNAAQADDVAKSVDYSRIVKEIRTLVEKSRKFTVEALAEDIANLCLNRPGVQKVQIRVEKPRAILDTDSVGVEIERNN
jgi:FolB domain-containing protein